MGKVTQLKMENMLEAKPVAAARAEQPAS